MKTWDPKIDDTKSKRDHCIGVKKGSKKSKKYLRVAKAVTKMSRKLSN
jgi:putative transposase